MNLNTKKFKEIKPKTPSKEDIKFYSTLEGKTVKHIISHDKLLYNNLEAGRKKRNKITHELIDKHDNDLLQKETEKALKHVGTKIVIPIFKKLSGKEVVPSMKLYTDGWNNALKECIDILEITYNEQIK